ncbi:MULTISPECIES: ATPase domain-containing protein [Halorussus]|uniref:ATPase domain-containing protein n=1 Tax=Halorussus TaxID=1070314 RepID=UPI00209C7816|nr:ATPase domain-containing protein [Halorussus vallis]USZ78270.1 AAA family ATPase [Halorussus vallis]
MQEGSPTRISAGTDGLDDVLRGGLIPGRGYLVRGAPGTGKTLLGINYLLAGVENDETVLYVNLEESAEEIRRNARSVGVDLSGVDFLDLSPNSDAFAEGQTYDIFAPDEVEGEPITEEITARVEELNPDRVFIDPVTQLRHLTADEYQFRKQVISLVRYLREQGATVLFTSQDMEDAPDEDLQFLSDGTIELARDEDGRTLSVPKFRGSGAREGTHAVSITDEGIQVYPSLSLDGDGGDFELETISSGVPAVDALLGGGLERGTVTVISGPTGVGKTTAGTQFIKEAAGRGERSVMYMFEESKTTFLERSSAVNIPVEAMLDHDALAVEEIEPLNHSAQEFANRVKEEVEERNASIVMLDGINGYQLSLPGDNEGLVHQLHTLCRYLKDRGVTVILIEEVGGVTGDFQATDVGISYLADNIVFLRHLELDGEMRKAIGVLKKRTSDFERMLREFRITEHGLRVGEPLEGLKGIMSGQPEVQRRDVDER